ncbi:hypothetical protein KUTeg_012129 [Tegillarca granosa]|uniref:Rho guanine nucleotide exchange factor 7 n=1 Tax=Tegillarca granosa TaxID=220873 RepID=A0ABQ9EYM8_TEGGR|nr:hypothetical protein KUTeg_012129 [Tegillarca granosa]
MLCFNKGDIITVTQVLDGGWWEGTLSGKTGWFPSNYVKELKTDFFGCDRVMGSKKGSEGVKVYKRESMQYYHSMVSVENGVGIRGPEAIQILRLENYNMVLQNVIETEKANVQEMTMVLQTYIQPLQNSGILTPTEYSQLVGNLEEIVTFQNMFLTSIEECVKNPPHQRRVGGAFIKHAPRLKELYLEYCANHPRAAAVESHVDRGDTQRAIAVYKDIANACMEVRKLKEMEYEILTSAIKGWEGEEIAKLGEVIHLSQVQLHTLAGDKHDRIFVLFPSVLVMLSMSPRLSGYQYEISTSQPSISLLTQAKTALVTHSTWSMSCLRPSPPLRQHLVCKDDGIRSPRMGRKPVRRKPDDPRTMEEDAVILKVIEAYCTSAKTRHTVNSLSIETGSVSDLTEIHCFVAFTKDKFTLVRPLPNPHLGTITEKSQLHPDVTTQALLTSAHVLIAEEEKIFIDDAGDPTVLQEKYLFGFIVILQDFGGYGIFIKGPNKSLRTGTEEDEKRFRR